MAGSLGRLSQEQVEGVCVSGYLSVCLSVYLVTTLLLVLFSLRFLSFLDVKNVLLPLIPDPLILRLIKGSCTAGGRKIIMIVRLALHTLYFCA